MKKIFLVCLSLSLFATNLINYNVYKRNDRLDVMLSFDSPYSSKDGDIRVLRGPGYVGVIISDLNINEKNSISLNLEYADKLLIYPDGQNAVFEFRTDKNIDVIPAVTKDDGFGLRIRVLPKAINKIINKKEEKIEESLIDYRYFLVVGVLLVIVLVLFILKRKIASKGNNVLVKENSMNFLNINPNKAKILCNKSLDKDNKFIALEYEGQIYKLIIGNTNIQLDDNNTKNYANSNFEDYFEENKQKLQNMIKNNALNAYKEKIAKF